MIGGYIIAATFLPDRRAIRFWVYEPTTGDEICVIGRLPRQGRGPQIFDQIWWQSGRIYYDENRQTLEKVGSTFKPDYGDLYNGRTIPKQSAAR